MKSSSIHAVPHLVGLVLGVAAIVVGPGDVHDRRWTPFSILSIDGGIALAAFTAASAMNPERL
jgi:hypothetical protein